MDTRNLSPRGSVWPPTDWSRLARLVKPADKDPEEFNRMILRYQNPLKIHLLQCFPGLEGQAEEIVQDFCVDKILQEGWLNRADPARGRFRNFLKTSLTNFVINRLRKEARAPASLEATGFDPPAEERTSGLFNLAWAEAIVAETCRRMELACKTPLPGKPSRQLIWEVAKRRLLRPILEDLEPMDYEELVKQCGLKSPAQAQNLLATAKRMFRRQLFAVISEYEQDGQSALEEIQEFRHFLAAFSQKN